MAYSWNSELPSGRNPFWIRDDALAGRGLHAGEAVSVDTRAEPADGDLVVVEVDLDGDSQRLARRYCLLGDDRVRLEPVGGPAETLEVAADSLIVMGVIVARVRFGRDGETIEEPLPSSD
jgi:SOS-response transcriptional repressor LexA